MNIPAIAKKLEQRGQSKWKRSYPIKGGTVEVRFYTPERGNPYAESYGQMVALEGDSAVGHLSLNDASDPRLFPGGTIKGLAFDIEVVSAYRRRGVGTALLKAARDQSGQKPIPSSLVQGGRQPSPDAQKLWKNWNKKAEDMSTQPNTAQEWQQYIDELKGPDLWSQAVNANSQLFADLLRDDGFIMADVQAIVTMFAERLLADSQRLPEGGAFDMRGLVDLVP